MLQHSLEKQEIGIWKWNHFSSFLEECLKPIWKKESYPKPAWFYVKWGHSDGKMEEIFSEKYQLLGHYVGEA